MPDWAESVAPDTVAALRESYVPDMPPIEGGEYLIGHLLDAGPSVAGAMGAGPLTSRDLLAWQEETGVELTPWQARTLRRLSVLYVNESHLAEKPDAQAPWQPVEPVVEHSSVQQALRALAKL